MPPQHQEDISIRCPDATCAERNDKLGMALLNRLRGRCIVSIKWDASRETWSIMFRRTDT